jgi:hypothetical protein
MGQHKRQTREKQKAAGDRGFKLTPRGLIDHACWRISEIHHIKGEKKYHHSNNRHAARAIDASDTISM